MFVREFCTRLFAAALMAVFVPSSARAASSVNTEGATISLHAVKLASGVRGAIEIDLEPGWKTYWISPGPVGLSPRIDLSSSQGLVATEILFPTPGRFQEGDIESIGYTQPMAIAIEARPSGSEPVRLKADILLGLCRDICVPVQVQLEADPGDSLSNLASVRRAFDALPTPRAPPPGWHLLVGSDGATLELALPSGELATSTEIFADAPEGWALGPALLRRAGRPGEDIVVFPILSRPANGSRLTAIDILLTRPEKAELIRALPVGRS